MIIVAIIVAVVVAELLIITIIVDLVIYIDVIFPSWMTGYTQPGATFLNNNLWHVKPMENPSDLWCTAN